MIQNLYLAKSAKRGNGSDKRDDESKNFVERFGDGMLMSFFDDLNSGHEE
jgi:hypothetical protein